MIHLVSTMTKYGKVCAKYRIMQYATPWCVWHPEADIIEEEFEDTRTLNAAKETFNNTVNATGGHKLGTERCQSRLYQILKQQTNCNQSQLKLYNIRN